MSVWVDVVTRVRGLAACVPSDRQLAAIARTGDLASLAEQLVPFGLPSSRAATSDPRALIGRVHHRAGGMLRLVTHWSGQRATLLAPLVEQEDCRSLHALLRALQEHIPGEHVLPSLLPTPSLSPRRLARLATVADAEGLAAMVEAMGHPVGPAFHEETRRLPADAARLDAALTRACADRARRVAPRSGRAMRTFVSHMVDLANVHSALVVAERGSRASTNGLFVDGGALVPRQAFLEAVALGSRRDAALMLAPFVRASPLEASTSSDPFPEERVLRALVREQRDIARLDPLGPAPIIEFVLRLRYTLLALQRTIWAVAAEAATAGLASTATA